MTPPSRSPDMSAAVSDMGNNASAIEILRRAPSFKASVPALKLRHDARIPDILSGDAVEQIVASRSSYAKWSSQIVKIEIRMAGWRLAASLEVVLQETRDWISLMKRAE